MRSLIIIAVLAAFASAIPSNIQIQPLGRNSVRLNWHQEFDPALKGFTVHYHNGDERTSEWSTKTIWDPRASETTIDGLNSAGEYSFCVRSIMTGRVCSCSDLVHINIATGAISSDEQLRRQQAASPQGGYQQGGYQQGGQAQPGYPQGQPQPGYPQGQPQPGYPQGQPQPGYPQGQPQPGYPQGQPQPGYPQGQPQPGYPQGQPQYPLGGYQQGGYNQQGGYQQGGQPQPNYAQGGYVQSGQQQGGYEQHGHQQSGQQQGGYEQHGHQQSGQQQGGYEQHGHQQSGQQQGGYVQTSHQQSEYEQSGHQQGAHHHGGFEQGGYVQSGQQHGGQEQDGHQQSGQGEHDDHISTEYASHQHGGSQQSGQEAGAGAAVISLLETGAIGGDYVQLRWRYDGPKPVKYLLTYRGFHRVDSADGHGEEQEVDSGSPVELDVDYHVVYGLRPETIYVIEVVAVDENTKRPISRPVSTRVTTTALE